MQQINLFDVEPATQSQPVQPPASTPEDSVDDDDDVITILKDKLSSLRQCCAKADEFRRHFQLTNTPISSIHANWLDQIESTQALLDEIDTFQSGQSDDTQT